MRTLLALCLLAAPALAEDPPAAPAEEDGFSLMEQGMKLVLQGMMAEMDPALDEMDQTLQGLEPALQDLGPKLMTLFWMIDDIGNYDAPVMLENGDILIRRKSPLPPPPDPEAGPDGEVEL